MKTADRGQEKRGKRHLAKFLRDNGLTLVLLFAFLVTLLGQILAGRRTFNEDEQLHGRQPVSLREYLTTGHFVEATAENWESEFLQMGVFVVLTCFLFQRGSAESKDPDEEEGVDEDPEQHRRSPEAPWPVRRGGWILKVYEHSLSLTFLLLFLFSFTMHALGGEHVYNDERLEHGLPPVGLVRYVVSSQFWFESFQNWQSEFLSVAAMVFLSVYLRQRGSPQSKPVHAPHDQTGE